MRNKIHLNLNNSSGGSGGDAAQANNEDMAIEQQKKRSNRLRNEDPLAPGPVGSS